MWGSKRIDLRKDCSIGGSGWIPLEGWLLMNSSLPGADVKHFSRLGGGRMSCPGLNPPFIHRGRAWLINGPPGECECGSGGWALPRTSYPHLSTYTQSHARIRTNAYSTLAHTQPQMFYSPRQCKWTLRTLIHTISLSIASHSWYRFFFKISLTVSKPDSRIIMTLPRKLSADNTSIPRRIEVRNEIQMKRTQ